MDAPMFPVEAFIFDLDDTIVETEQLNVDLIGAYFREQWRITLDSEDAEIVFGRAWPDIFEFLIRKYSITATPDSIQQGFLKKKEQCLKTSVLRVARGLDKVLGLPQRKVIVTGSGRAETFMILDNAGLSGRFDAVFSVDEYKNGKPMPDGFIMALEYLSVDPGRVVGFEDARAGIEAAVSAGIVPVFIREFARHDVSALARLSFDDFKHFFDYFTAPGDRSRG